jgi:hypothetical protein
MKGILFALLIYVTGMGQTISHDKIMHFSSCSKEIYDMRCGHSDMKDMYANILGAAVGSIVVRIRF